MQPLLQKKGMGIIHSEFVFLALVIRYAKCMRRTKSPSATSPTPQHLCTLSYKQLDFWSPSLKIKRVS